MVFSAVAGAKTVATVVRGVGAGADKPASFVSHYLGVAVDEDPRFEKIDVSLRVGDYAETRSGRALEVALEQVEKGRAAYELLELEPAVEFLNTALNKYERHAAAITDLSRVTDVLMLLGASQVLRGEDKIGAKWLAQAIAISPGIAPDPHIFNADMRQVFVDASHRLEARPKGSLSISSTPSYASVFIDGKFAGVTPMAVNDVVEGRHFLRVVKDGYCAWGQVVDVVGDADASQSARLKPATRFDEFDNWADKALNDVRDKDRGDRAGSAVAKLGELLDVDNLLLSEVRLDGDRIELIVALVDVHDNRLLMVAADKLSYDQSPDAYRDEILTLFEIKFSEVRLQKGNEEGPPGDGPGPVDTSGVQPSGVCWGMPCAQFKTYVLGIGAGGGGVLTLLGMLFDYLALTDHNEFLETPQTSSNSSSLESAGRTKAIVGDVLVGVGMAVAIASVGYYLFWNPSPDQTVAFDRDEGGWSVSFVPLEGGAAFSAMLEF